MNQQTILNFTENIVHILVIFALLFSIFMVLLRFMMYLLRSTSPSSSNARVEKSNKVPVAPRVTKSEIEESQLKRLAKEKETVK
jgi:hypothetical protein